MLVIGAVTAPWATAQTDDGQAESTAVIEEVVVRAHPLPTDQLAQSYRVVDGAELLRRLDSNLGAVVGQLPGVSTTSFGQAVGRPVIHGLGGTRVRVMEDHIPSLDASVLSDDHAVTIDPSLADSIDILKGPAALIYGSGAIGGVVDVHSGRVPATRTDEPFSGRIGARLDDASDQRSGAARFDGMVGALAWHADGFRRVQEDYDIPGYAESAALRRSEADEAGDEDAPPEARGTLPNSDVDAEGAGFGVSWVGDTGYVGIARSGIDMAYGLPGGHGHHHHDEPEAQIGDDPLLLAEAGEAEGEDGVRLDLHQRRWDVAAGLQEPLTGWREVSLRVGVNDYEHSEIEAPGEVGTRYSVEAWETRLQAEHAPWAGWQGVVGLQVGHEDFVAVGEEAYLPAHESATQAVFVVEERALGDLTVQAGARLEQVSHDADGVSDEQFTVGSLSGGVLLPFATDWELGVVIDLAQRAPAAAELYSNGPHLATGAFEVGDPGLDIESSNNLAGTLRYRAGRAQVEATLYANRFQDFIYQADTGLEADELPIRVWSQADALFHGLDLEARYALMVDGPVLLDLRFTYDFVNATLDLDDEDQVPRLPPDRLGIGLELRSGVLGASIDYLRAMDQDQAAALETETPGYDDLRAEISGTFELGSTTAVMYLQGRNLTDDDQRNHVSFIKEFAPLPGRTIVGGVRLEF
jgi:iron complex outermembrane receptor protein